MSIKRVHFKGRGKNGEASNRPTCEKCGEDLKRSYVYEKKETGKYHYIANGWECKGCRIKIWN